MVALERGRGGRHRYVRDKLVEQPFPSFAQPDHPMSTFPPRLVLTLHSWRHKFQLCEQRPSPG
jgi:hypothetical protein